jgi:D-alanyl-D-alanine carboxypeptidase
MLSKFKNFFNMETRTKYFIHVLVCFLIASVLIFALFVIGEKSSNKKVVAETPNAFAEVNLEAKGAVVWDVINSRELFSKNSDLPLPLASLTKIMTAVTIASKFPDPSNIKIAKEYLAPEGDSGLVVGDTWKASDLRDFTLLTSSNDGAFALAAVAEAQVASDGSDPQAQFIKAMNDTASQIGLLNSKFFNEHGLDRAADKGGAYGSAHDMAALFEYTLKNYPEILEVTRYKSVQFKSTEKKYSAENTNILVDKIPNLIASKTGFTDLAGGNLVIAFDAGLNRPIIISVLGSTEQGRFSDVQKLVDASLKYISQ